MPKARLGSWCNSITCRFPEWYEYRRPNDRNSRIYQISTHRKRPAAVAGKLGCCGEALFVAGTSQLIRTRTASDLQPVDRTG